MTAYDEISAFTSVDTQPIRELKAPVDKENEELFKNTLQAHGCTFESIGEPFYSPMIKEAQNYKITFPEKTEKHIGIFSTPSLNLYTVIFPDGYQFRVREVHNRVEWKVIIMLPKAEAN